MAFSSFLSHAYFHMGNVGCKKGKRELIFGEGLEGFGIFMPSPLILASPEVIYHYLTHSQNE